jgi:lipoprotein-anchoring transpeptidase ErfK/SrfK
MSRRGRHTRSRRGLTTGSVVLGLVAFLFVLLAGAAWAGYRYERARTQRILPGTRIAGIDVSGMTADEAERALTPVVTDILERPIEVTGGGREWQLTAQSLGTKVDPRAAIEEALAQSKGYHWTERLYHRLLDRPVDVDLDLPVTHDAAFVRWFVKEAATRVARAPRDAYLDVVDGELATQASRPGRELRLKASKRRLLKAVRGDAASVRLPMRKVHPSVSEESLGKTIIVRISENRLYLYDGLDLVKTYPVATGLPEFPTPVGHWTIVNKRINPTWVNPARDGWGRDLPEVIPPGPDNPLGTRALDLDAPGIRIHGTYAAASIGTYASHGCIRMYIADSEELFDLVETGTMVIIVG